MGPALSAPGPAERTCDGSQLSPDSLPPPAFQRAVMAALAAVPELGVAARGPFQLRLAFGPRGFEVRLDDLYRRYRHDELSVAGAAEEIKAALGVPGAAVLAAGPFPRLARRRALAAGVLGRPCPFDPELAVFFVRSLPSGHVPLGPGEAADEGALWAESLAALRALTLESPGDAEGEGPTLVLRYQVGDGLDAARALLPDLVASLAAWLPGEARLALPCRDLLVAIGTETDPAVAAALRAEVAARFAADPEPLSPRWYRADAAGRLAPDPAWAA